MDKKEALKILINNSALLSDEERIRLLSQVDGMSDITVENLGKFLAIEKKQSLEAGEEIMSELDKIIEEEKNSSSA